MSSLPASLKSSFGLTWGSRSQRTYNSPREARISPVEVVSRPFALRHQMISFDLNINDSEALLRHCLAFKARSGDAREDRRLDSALEHTALL